MYNNKPTFGGNTTFGGFNSTASTTSPFGGFKSAAAPTSAFGAAPAFGAAAPQQNTGGLFGTSNTSSGLFGGSTSTATPAFGATSSGFGGFGATTSSGLFGAANNTSSGIFGNAQPNTSFGAKPAGFGFGATSTTGASSGGLFGSAPAAGGGLFAQQNTTLGGGLFSNNTSTFGAAASTQTGTAHVKYSPLVGTDTVVKSGNQQSINIKHHCITCMKEYEGKSLEELRLEDYQAGRKGSSGGMFGFQQTESKPLFGGPTFGQAATTTTTSVFGAPALSTSTFPQTNTFSFGNNTQNAANTTGGLFGAAKPAFGATTTPGTGLFGATTTQAPAFGTNTSTFGFGSNTQTPQTGGLFGAKPATTGFGTSTAGGFGGFGGGSLFAAKPAQTAAPAFGTATPAFGSLGTGGFGTTTSTAGGGLFGANNSTFGKPLTTQPTFGFNAPNTGLGTGVGGGLGTNTFQAKPAAPAFGALGGGLFNTQPNNTFGNNNSLGGGLFGNTSSLGGSTLGGMGLGTNNTLPLNNSLSGASAAGNVHEQILNLVARPYGDSPLFKDLPADTPASSDALKPTNPAAVKAVLDSSNNYRVTNASIRLKLHANAPHDKKSLFDGLEESDPSLEEKLSLKPSRKRLVLRPKGSDMVDGADANKNRSLEEHTQNSNVNGMNNDQENNKYASEEERCAKDNHNDSNDLETSSDRHGSWLNASKHHWSAEKEKLAETETTPRLYPNLDKDAPQLQTSERRASWLTSKPLIRKPLSSNPEAAESSVRELGVRPPSAHPQDKENDTPSVIEEEHVAPRDMPPHPTGVKLTRPGYYTIPSLDEMIKYMRPDGSCVVPHLTIGRKNYGNVFYDCEIDVAGLDLDSLVHFMNKEVTIYPDDMNKPPVGQGLNRRAIVTLDRIWPRDKTEKRPITDPDRLLAMDYEGKLRRVCDKHDTKFIEYRPQTGSWVFRVEHFSKYSLTDSDEEDEITPDVLKRQLVNNQMQKAAPVAPPKPVQQHPGLGGLGGPLYATNYPITSPNAVPLSSNIPTSIPNYTLNSQGGDPANGYGLSGEPLVGHNDLYAMQQTSLNLLSGAGKAFEMDTTEDNAEAPSLYQDGQRSFGVKSPTGELARLEHRHSHNVQLMKASLYADTEMEDDASVSTGDQLVPRETTAAIVLRESAPALQLETRSLVMEEPQVTGDDEIPMKPLIVRPHTIVLKYHRKVPPFKKTIAGRLNAACIADMAVCRARHSRVGFGPRSNMVFPTSYDSLADLPKSGELFELGRYVRGRTEDDWSEPVVARLAIQQPEDDSFLDTMSKHLETLLKYSNFTESESGCPRLCVTEDPAQRRAALLALIDNCGGESRTQFGVASPYSKEVLLLCDALWGADLDNGGIPGTDEASIVDRYRKLLQWMTASVAAATDDDLKKPHAPEKEDESDVHSVRVWTLLLGGRILDACKLCVENGDCNMAALIAQCSGDEKFRSLLRRQLSLWSKCGADTLMSTYKLASLRLVAGDHAHRDQLELTDWMRALHATHRYVCQQVPTLEQTIKTYESMFLGTKDPDSMEFMSLTAVDDDMGMKLPLPPYVKQFQVCGSNSRRRVLDLRYELMRARAYNTRPKLQPASYTPDPMDYSLCFVVGAWLGAASGAGVCGVSAQLEAAGAWHLAVNAMLYHPDCNARQHLVRGILSRHAPARCDSAAARARVERVRSLRVPDQWLLLAQAHRAKYEGLHAIEAELLVGAEQWNAAHKVLLDELLPEAVLSDNLQSIAPLLEKLNAAAERHEVSGWESGGQALHHYIHVCDQIRGLVSSAEAESTRGGSGGGGGGGNVAARLEALRPRVAAACRALGRLRCPTARHLLSRSEMGARLVQLSVCAGEPPPHVAAILHALRLPPDCTATALHKITTDLADAASEMCIETTSGSPQSAQRRVAAS